MNMFLPYVVVMVVVVAYGSLAGAQRPASCCQPAQYECIMAGQGTNFYAGSSQTSSLQLLAFLSVDFTNQRIYVSENYTVTPGSTRHLTVISDYRQGISFTIVGNKCYKTRVPSGLNRCIPDSAHFFGAAYFGLNSSPFKFYAYQWKENNIDTTMDVTQEQCFPFAASVKGSNGDNPYFMAIGYVNMNPGIRDPAVFTPPSICNSIDDTQMAPPEDTPAIRHVRNTLGHVFV